MSFHAGQTFTFGEQPSATKWQYLWDNDYALADGSGISNNAIDSRHILAGAVDFVHLGPDIGAFQVLADVTLGGAADIIDTGTITAKKFLKLYFFGRAASGVVGGTRLRFNNDSGNNYAYSGLYNTGSGPGFDDLTSTDGILNNSGNTVSGGSYAFEAFINNPSTQNKQVFITSVSDTATAASTRPSPLLESGKWASSAQVTRIQNNQTGGGDFASGTRLLVVGRD